MRKIIDFLTENPVFYYATVEGDQPRVRPFGFFMDFKKRLYIGMGTHKPCYRQTIANPKFEISTASKDGRWIRVRGKAVADTDPEAEARAFEVMPDLKKIYSPESGLKLGLFHIADGEADFCDMTGQCEKIGF